MLCELSFGSDSFLFTWAVFALLGTLSIVVSSGSLFYFYYINNSYEKWTRKSNANFPKPTMIRKEIKQTLKGIAVGALCPAASLYHAQQGEIFGIPTKAYCGMDEANGRGIAYHVAQFGFLWLCSDFCEFFYHYLGHSIGALWTHHKHHHIFFNPSPFATIADELVDQFVRSSPMLIFPILFPVNVDLLFFQFAVFFYCYGTYLHWGYELDWLDAHNPIINTSFQHYLHHAISTNSKPYHCGFFFKIWDKIFGSEYPKDCFCAKCQREQGKRSREAWEKLEKPNYEVLKSPTFWWTGVNPAEEKGKAK